MFGQARYADINQGLNEAFARKKALIAIHRGAWGGNIIENTIMSYTLSLQMGADMFECDISKSTDGIPYAFHDGGERRMLGIEPNIQTLSSAEIDELIYRNSIGQPSGYHVERFDRVAAHFKNGELYNVDRSWYALPETTAVISQYPWAIHQALIKTPAVDEALAFFNECPQKYMYMPIVYSMADVERVLSYPDINTVGMELIANTPDSELFSDEAIAYVKSRGLFTWANAITLSGSERHILFGGLDDDKALFGGMDASWGEILRKGLDIVQTDWPMQLKTFRDAFFHLEG